MARPSWSRSRARPTSRWPRRRQPGRVPAPRPRLRAAAQADAAGRRRHAGCGPCSGGQPSWSSSSSVQPAVMAARRTSAYARWQSVMCRSAAARASTAASIARAASARSPIRSTLVCRNSRAAADAARLFGVSHALGHGPHAAGGSRTRSRPRAGLRAGDRPEPDRRCLTWGAEASYATISEIAGRARLRRATLAEPNRSPAPRARGARREDAARPSRDPSPPRAPGVTTGRKRGRRPPAPGGRPFSVSGVAVGVGAGADHGDGGARGARGECVARAGRSSAGGTPRHRGGVDDARRFRGAGGDGHLPAG